MLRMAGEQDLISRIARAMASRLPNKALRLGIGDDAAIVRPRPGRELVLTCDSFLEGVHFLSRVHPPESVGYKALARATSDLAAVGADPRYFLLSLALPRPRTGAWLNQFLKGMARAAHRFGLRLIGGDTAQHRSIAISITVLGEISPGLVVTRAGARPGDLICTSGVLGRAQLGLELVLRGLHRQRRWRALLQHHLHPSPRLALGKMLARRRLASAMIDTSDGLSTDLARLCDASGVGAEIEVDRLPLVRVPPELEGRGLEAARLGLHGGEDYELLFTVPQRRVRLLPASFQGLPLTPIGRITRKTGIRLLKPNGRSESLPRRGWDHFRD
jgi:thiamine-monophosphate kinase